MKKYIRHVDTSQTIETTKPVVHSRVLLAWTAPEGFMHERGALWYVFYGAVLSLVLVYSFMSGSWSTALVFLLLACVYLMSLNHPTREIQVAITELGIQVDTKFYPFSDLKGFWLVFKPPYVTTLHILRVGRREDLVIQLANQLPAQVRSCLSLEIPELEGKKESFLHKIIRIGKL